MTKVRALSQVLPVFGKLVTDIPGICGEGKEDSMNTQQKNIMYNGARNTLRKAIAICSKLRV
jgi:hypothetical protein